MIRKITYYVRLICSILYLVMSFLMLDYIFQSGNEGIFFLITLAIFVISTLWSLLSQKRIFQNMISYNLIIIALTFYFGVITVRLLLDTRLIQTSLYVVNLEYCKTNFIILSLVMIGMALNTIILYITDNEKKKPCK